LWLGTIVQAGKGSFQNRKLGTFLIVAPQPKVLATNGGYHRIRHTRKVQKYPSTEFLTIVVMYEQVVKRWRRNSETQKIGTFLLVEPQPAVL